MRRRFASLCAFPPSREPIYAKPQSRKGAQEEPKKRHQAGALQMTIPQTLADLVAVDSVSSRSNAEIISYLERRCTKIGLLVEKFSHIDEDGAQKINLIARSSPSQEVQLALVGHTDTVPYDPNWSEALRLTERDARLFGRGACDTKAFIAAALTALESIDLSALVRPLALVFTCDEEIGCLGAKRLADARAFTSRYAIVGEPTQLQPMRAGKGYCLAQVIVRGREAHSAYPQLGSSAILRAARLIEKIASIAEQLQKDRHEDFDPPYTTLNIGLITGGSAKNVIPGECRFTLEWRTIPGQKSDHVLSRVNEAIAELRGADAEFKCELDADRADNSFETRANSPLVQFLESATGKKSGTVAFGTEAPSVISLGAEAVVFGPGDIRVAHRTGEFVPLDQLNDCGRILRQAIVRFCS